MQEALRSLFSPAGRLARPAFAYAIAAVYLAGIASQWLTAPALLPHGGLWLFAAAQALLVWLWFALHARRLRDAGRGIGPAVGVALLYAITVMFLVAVAASFLAASANQMPDVNSASAMGLILFVAVIAILLGSPHYDLTWLVVAILTVLAVLPVVFALALSVWTLTQPSRDGRVA